MGKVAFFILAFSAAVAIEAYALLILNESSYRFRIPVPLAWVLVPIFSGLVAAKFSPASMAGSWIDPRAWRRKHRAVVAAIVAWTIVLILYFSAEVGPYRYWDMSAFLIIWAIGIALAAASYKLVRWVFSVS